MNHSQILKRAWTILWNYRALWIFGMALSLTTFSPNGNTSNVQLSSDDFNNGQSFITPPPEVAREIERLVEAISRVFTLQMLDRIAGLIITLVCVTLAMVVVFLIGNYISRVALIRMVDHYETTEQKMTWKQGFHLGWSPLAWRLFLIDLATILPAALIFIALFGCAALPLANSMMARQEPDIVSIVTMIGASFLVIFLAFIVALLFSLVMELIQRECVLQENGVFESIRQGLLLLRSQIKNIFSMWLILLGINIAFAVALIPVMFLLLGIGALVGGGLGYLTYSAWGVAGDLTTLITAIAVGVIFFILTMGIPLTFLGGLRETYISTAWTLTYREAKLLDNSAAEILTQVESAPEI